MSEPEPAPVVEKKPADDGWGDWGISIMRKGKIGKKVSVSAAVPDPPKEEPTVEPPQPELVVEEKAEDDWSSYRASTTTTEKKTGKKGGVEEHSLPPPAEAPIVEVINATPKEFSESRKTSI
jgi:hypothetical protein